MKQEKMYCVLKGEINNESKELIKLMKKFFSSQYFAFQYYEKNKRFGINIYKRELNFADKIRSGQRLKGRDLELQDKMPEALKKLLK